MHLLRPRIGIAASAAVLLCGVVAAQPPSLSTFSKWGLRPVPWSSGSSLQVGSVDSGSAGIALTFDYDAGVGAVLSHIGHRGTQADGTVTRWDYLSRPPAGQPQGFWRAVTTPLSGGTSIDITPDSALGTFVWADDSSVATHAIFQWFGCTSSNPNATSAFWVEVSVKVDPSQPARAEWETRMARIQLPKGSEPYTIDEIEVPIVYAQQPGDSRRARILVPAALSSPLPSTNLSMRLWRSFGLGADLEHPARGQQMQFSTLYSGDFTFPQTTLPTGEVVSPFRKALYFTTEDTTGHYKRFRHNVVVGSNGLEYYRWAPVYFPAWGPSPWLNVFDSPYPAVMCALQAQTDAYWYDVASHYRDFVRSDMGLVPADQSPLLNQDFLGASTLVLTSIFKGNNTGELPAIFADFTDTALNFKDVFTDSNGQPSPMFMEWQKWLQGDPMGENPIGPGNNPAPFTGFGNFKQPTQATYDEITRAYQNGINMSMYSVPLSVNPNDWTTFQDKWFLHHRDGSIYTPNNNGGILVDYGVQQVPPWMQTTLYDDILDTIPAIGGMFLDTVGGQGSFLRYPSFTGTAFNFRYHGGDLYVQGAQSMIDLVRSRIGSGRPTNQHPDVPLILTEAVQEFYAGHYDFAQHGYKPLPLQTQLNNVLDQLVGLLPPAPPAPVESSMPNPPLWNAVYHEYSSAGAVAPMLSTLAVSGLLGGGQTNPAYPGLTWPQWGNYMRMVYALEFVQGIKAAPAYYYDYRDLGLLVRRNGVVEARNPAVPQQVQLIAFLKRLHAAVDDDAEAGQFVSHGVMERPLAMPTLPFGGYNPFVVTTTPNPSTLVAAVTDPAKPGALHFYEDAFTEFPYTMPNVLHTVWRADPTSDRLAVVFVNWSDGPAAWTATFDPAAYGRTDSHFTVSGLRPTATGVDEYAIGQGDGPSTFGWGAPADVPLMAYDAAAPGFMPGRSVQVIVID